MCYCKANDEKGKNDMKETPKRNGMPSILISMQGEQQFTLPVWALFWMIGPLLWWGTSSLQVLSALVIAALVLGVRIHLSMETTTPKRKNDDLL